MEKQKENHKKEKAMSEAAPNDVDACNYAPEFAEHARFHDDNEPCDDGRAALAHPTNAKE